MSHGHLLDFEVGMAGPVDQSRPWAVSIEADLDAQARDRRNADRSYKRSASVFRVPSLIKALKPQLYHHQVLSFGLYDRDFVNMSPIDKVRLEVVSEFLEQIKEMPNSTVHSWDALCECVAGPVHTAKELRHFYHHGPDESPINLDSTTVRSVLTFDAVFLTVFSFVWSGLRTQLLNCGRFEDIFLQKGLTEDLQQELYYDTLLLENQIPLALVRQVWNQMSVDKSDHRFNSHIRRTLFGAMRSYLVLRGQFMCDDDHDHHISFVECNHLLHCLYIAVCNRNTPGPASDSDSEAESDSEAPQPMEDTPPSESQSPLHPERMTTSSIFGAVVSGITRMCAAVAYWTRSRVRVGRRRTYTNGFRSERSLPTATELHKAGVHFRGSGEETSLSEIRLEKSTLMATLYLPRIDIEDSTEKVLLNLTSFEATHSTDEHKLSSYVRAMNELIDTEEDVRLLRKGNNPVIGINYLGDDKEIATLFNTINQNALIVTSKVYRRLEEEVNDWCTQELRQNVIRFVDRFFDRPWILVSLIAATLLLVMTALQTVYTMKGFYQQS